MRTIPSPSQPRVLKEDRTTGAYEIDGLSPGYGHTLGNSLRRIILSSLPGAAVTGVKITGAPHEFSTLDGVKEDVIALLLNIKRVRFALVSDESQTITLSAKGPKEITAAAFECPGQVSVQNPEQHIASLGRGAGLEIEARVERGLGFVPKEVLQKERVDIGAIAVDAVFSPVRRVNYEVENMRVGDRTDFNRLRLFIETDGTITPRAALEQSIQIMLQQLRAVVGFREDAPVEPIAAPVTKPVREPMREIDPEILKTRIDTLDLSARAKMALSNAGIRTVGGLARKREEDILDIDGLGSKGVQEVKKMLGNFGITLK
jgi:DNA-directed RNA polymerase subunit alpha